MKDHRSGWLTSPPPVVGLHHILPLLELLLALLAKVGLGHVLHEALDDPRLAWLDVLAIDNLLLRAELVELGPQTDVAVLDGGELHLLVAALVSQLVLVEPQALMDTTLAGLHILAIRLHVTTTSLRRKRDATSKGISTTGQVTGPQVTR